MDRRIYLIAILVIPAIFLLILRFGIYERKQLTEQMYVELAAQNAERLITALNDTDASTAPVVMRVGLIFGAEAKILENFDELSRNDTPLVHMLRERLAQSPQIFVVGETECNEPPTTAGSKICRALHILLRDGTHLRVVLRMPSGLVMPVPLLHLASYVAVLCLSISLLTYLITLSAMRPIKELAQAAANLGADIDGTALPEKGPALARQAAAAFNAMQARIRRQIQHRTHMLAAITHDLQTPLTRLRLRLEKINDEQLRDKLVEDLSVVQSLVKDGLELARSMESTEAKHLLDLDSLVDSVCADALDAGLNVTVAGRSDAFVMAQSNPLRRCITNLVDNAIKYGRYADVRVGVENDMATIRVHDGGAGIPADQLDAVFDPFFRLEPSRSRDTGGTGLGLTIARNIAQNHGGALVLRNHPEGGLEAQIILPIKRHR